MINRELNNLIRSAKDDIVDRDEQQFHDITDSSHNGKPDST
jgi:hypothetical protein